MADMKLRRRERLPLCEMRPVSMEGAAFIWTERQRWWGQKATEAKCRIKAQRLPGHTESQFACGKKKSG